MSVASEEHTDPVPGAGGGLRGRWRRLQARVVGRGGSGLTVRLRLSVLYGALFLLSGITLLAFTYTLVSRHLPTGAFFAGQVARSPGPLRVILTTPVPGVASAVPNFVAGPAGPLPAPAQILAQLQNASDHQRATTLHQLLTDSGIALAVMVVASSLFGWIMAGRALRPVEAMAHAARDISEHNLHARLPEAGPRDEIRNLAATFNALLGRLEAAFDSQRRFVANASHELRTPLTLERAVIEVALADPEADAESLRAMGRRVLDIGAHQEDIIEALIVLARSQRGLDTRAPVDLAATVSDCVDSARPAADAAVVVVESDLQDATVMGDQRLVERLVANLVDNAVVHNYRGGWIRLATATADGVATVRVSNSGPVVSPPEIARLLQPFQRLDDERLVDGTGLGLGLSIVDAIATAHGARLEVAARPGGGMDVSVTFASVRAGP